jgi:hypothetical protein
VHGGDSDSSSGSVSVYRRLECPSGSGCYPPLRKAAWALGDILGPVHVQKK